MQMKPILDSQREGAVDTYRDKAVGGYPLAKLERLLHDCEDQPLWRDTADLCCAYVDGKQLTAEQKYLAVKNKLVPRVTNLIGRTIRSVLGAEAKNRRDAHLEPDDDQWADVCDVMSVKLKQAQRETLCDMAVSNAYGSQVSAGIGWVEVSRVSDPLEFPYRVQDVHRSEIWWDWRAKHITLKDARWLCRKRWIDLDEAEAVMPQFADVFQRALNNWQDVLGSWQLSAMDERFQSAYRDDRQFNVQRSTWLDGGRRRIKFFEVWYRVPATVVMIKVGPRWIQYDDQNRYHAEAVSRGVVEIKKGVTSQVRMALFAGPFRLLDVATKKRRFPYIPFFAFRDDADNSPYGLVHGMLEPQDEYNERRMRIQWMLKAQQIQVDNDALDPDYNNISDLAENAMRPDMLLVLKATRQNKGADAVRIGNSMQLQNEQFEVMQDAKQLIQDVPGVYSTQLGNAPAGVTSGIAINSLVEQGQVAMGELNDNYGLARNSVFEALLDLCAEDMLEPNMQVPIGAGDSRRVVVLNTFAPVVDPQSGQPVVGQDGQPALDKSQPINQVKDMCLNVGLAEVPSSPAYQMQASQQLGDMVRALAGMPQAAVLVPAWVENTQALGPSRKQLADDMRRMSGLPVAGDRAGAQAWQASQQQAVQQKQAADAQAQAAEIASKAADAQHTQAMAVLDAAQARKAAAEATQINLDVAHQFHGGIPQPADPYPGKADPAANQPEESDLINRSLAEAAA
jgi:hypothetical protein